MKSLHKQNKRDSRFIFYCHENLVSQYKKYYIGNEYTALLWKPSKFNIIPLGFPLFPFCIWWVMHYFHIFKNHDYGLFVVYCDNTLVHRSGIFPGYFRFPFMSEYDLQIGDMWTHPKYRNKGIASFAIKEILISEMAPSRKFWYIVENSNLASIRVIEKVGFTRVGEGIRRKRFGFKLLGAFEMITKEVIK